ncbi:ACT domain-containing protein [Secundilactobacillus yichangensis]|uniref:ACT domain-containing protein n=1 Tax=Secundilactobacillus yichangensis TaxID=2799580 RepID=UPI001944A98D|nr:ACT domain-containing protein [Secundilactobacillus yichangensis]
MKIIITVVGNDKVGIVAAVSKQLAELNVNITDMSQTLMHGSFTMMLMGEFTPEQTAFDTVQKALTELGKSIGVEIHTQRQELFDAIQKL